MIEVHFLRGTNWKRSLFRFAVGGGTGGGQGEGTASLSAYR